MARQRRLWSPGDVLSVVVRAHEGRPVFATEDDRRFLVERLADVLDPEATELLAWAVLINHLHLVLRVCDAAPETLFRRLNTAVAMRERRRRGDQGAVLQGRYWSRPCDSEAGLLSALTYVLGNPVHHGAVPSAEALETYAWSGYGEALGVARPLLLDPGRTLAMFHPEPALARAALRDAMQARVARWRAQRDGTDVCEEPGCRGAPDDCRLVHPRRVRARDAGGVPPAPPLPWRPAGISSVHDERMDRRARLRAAGWRPSNLVGPVCERLGADPRDVTSGRRFPAASAARAVIVHVACDGVGIPGETMAVLLGVTGVAVSLARRRGAQTLSTRGWTFDEVLSWRNESGAPAASPPAAEGQPETSRMGGGT